MTERGNGGKEGREKRRTERRREGRKGERRQRNNRGKREGEKAKEEGWEIICRTTVKELRGENAAPYYPGITIRHIYTQRRNPPPLPTCLIIVNFRNLENM